MRFSFAFVNAVATSFCSATLKYAFHAACARLLFFFLQTGAGCVGETASPHCLVSSRGWCPWPGDGSRAETHPLLLAARALFSLSLQCRPAFDVRGCLQAGGYAEPMESDEHRTNTVRKPLEKRENRENRLFEEKEEHSFFFENTVFTVFACLQQSSCGFRMVFVRFSSAFVNAVATSFCFATLRYALHAACARLLFLANRRRLCRGNGQPSLSCVVTWVVPVA